MYDSFTFDDVAEEEEEEQQSELFECVACRKVFKSETALLNHKNILLNVWSEVLNYRESKTRNGREEAERGNAGGRRSHGAIGEQKSA